MNKNIKFPFGFFTVTFIWSWLWWMPLVLSSLGIISISEKLFSKIMLPIGIIGAFGPLVGALFALYRESGQLSSIKTYLRSFLKIRLGWKVYLIPFVILGLCNFIAWFTPEIFGAERMPILISSVKLFIPYLLIMIFLGGGQEEFGWRGYALPILEGKFGIWTANIILGIIWACWHIPLWFIKGSNQSYMNFLGFMFLTIGYSFIFSWVREISKNRPFSYLFVHGTANALIFIMPVLVLQRNVPQPRFWIWVMLTFFIGIFITILRKNKSNNLKLT